jgi:hypothetical protein
MPSPKSGPEGWQAELTAIGREATAEWERRGVLTETEVRAYEARARATGAPEYALAQFGEGLALKLSPYPFPRADATRFDDYAPVTFLRPGEPDPEDGLERLDRMVEEDDDELRARLKLRTAPPCPKCGGARGVPIQRGEPGDPAFDEASKRGLVVLGGCIVRGDWSDPAWSCRDCGHEFGTIRELLDEPEESDDG